MRQKLICAVLVLLILWGAVSLLASRYGLCVTHLTISAEVPDPLHIVQLSDLHNARFGQDNDWLVKRVAEEKPDLIFLTGDMYNASQEDTTAFASLVQRLAELAPVYASPGNHEREYAQNFGMEPEQVYEQADAALLDYDYVDVTVKGAELRIGGFYGYAISPESQEKESKNYVQATRFLLQFQNTDRVKLLLCHMPVSWLEYGCLDGWDVDVVFAGHAHGGQVRIPLIGGLYAPDQGWFPGRLCGAYFSQDGAHTLVLSRGLGSEPGKLPRFGNVPEIVSVTLVPDVESTERN